MTYAEAYSGVLAVYIIRGCYLTFTASKIRLSARSCDRSTLPCRDCHSVSRGMCTCSSLRLSDEAEKAKTHDINLKVVSLNTPSIGGGNDLTSFHSPAIRHHILQFS